MTDQNSPKIAQDSLTRTIRCINSMTKVVDLAPKSLNESVQFVSSMMPENLNQTSTEVSSDYHVSAISCPLNKE